MGTMSRYAAEVAPSSLADKKKTLKQSDAISAEIDVGYSDKHEKVFICVCIRSFIEAQ